jgi:hypothetical protein
MVAVAVVGMVEVAVDEVIGMSRVGDGGVAAAGAVRVVGGMAGAAMPGCADVGIHARGVEGVLIVMIVVVVVQMAVMKVVDMTVVNEGHMATAGAVDMIVRVMCVV